MRKIFLLGLMLFAFATFGAAQQADLAFGVTTTVAPDRTFDAFGNGVESLRGGFYPAFSADYLFAKGFGFGGQVAWRGKQGLYGGYQPFRPILYDFNAVYSPNLKYVAPELQAGFGGLSSRFYTGTYTCSFTSCSNYVSSNHLLGHIGAGLKLYVKGPFFVRPEAHFYFVRNNEEYSSGKLQRYGVSIGYTFRSEAP